MKTDHWNNNYRENICNVSFKLLENTNVVIFFILIYFGLAGETKIMCMRYLITLQIKLISVEVWI